jgi:predicted nucleic acid-binding protein
MIRSKTCVLDASVFVAALLPKDINHAEALKQLAMASQKAYKICIPFLFKLEVQAALLRRSRSELWPKAMLAIEEFEVVNVSEGEVSTQIDQYRLRCGDAFYAAVAKKVKGTLVTLDEELLKVNVKQRK